MKKIFVFLFCILLLFSLAACNPSDDGNNKGDGNDVEPNDSITTDFSDQASAQNADFYKNYSQTEKDLYYLLWQETTSVSVKIDISASELAKINEAYESGDEKKIDTYRKCNLVVTVNGADYAYDEVGIRMRGNTSKRSFCNQNGLVFDFVHFRFSLTETFDGEEYGEGSWGADIANVWNNDDARAARKNRTFATMKKFYYKWNKNYDNTYVREIYANKAFRAYGILAPHVTLAQISLKQQNKMESLGVAMFYETIDKQFLKRNFSAEEAVGDLYKCAYTEKGPANLTTSEGRGVEVDGQRFTYALKTNDDRNAPDYGHHQNLINLIDTLKISKNASDFVTKLQSIVDMDYFCNFEAVNYMLGNPDCIRNNSNNYYLYFLPSGKVYFIPYDYDRCLGINVDWNPSGDALTSQKPYSTAGAAGTVRNPLYTKTILSSGLPNFKNLYKAKLQNVLNGKWFTYQNFMLTYNNYFATYQGLVMPSQTIQKQCAEAVRMDMLQFSTRGTDDLSSASDNVTVQNYLQLKRQCAQDNL